VVDRSAVAALGSAGGVWTRTQAHAAGLTRAQVERLLRAGTWQPLQRGIYTDGGTQPHPTQRAAAACLAAGPGAVALGRTAARVHGLPLVDDDDPATGRRQHLVDDVATREGTHRVVRRARSAGERELVVSQAVLPPEDVVLVSGVRVASAARTLFELARVLEPAAAVAATDHGLRTGTVDLDQLVAQASRLEGHRGVVAFRRVLELADARAESAFESVTRVVVSGDGMPAWTPQLPVLVDGRLVARLDLGNEALRLAVESDGGAHHSGAAVARDRARDDVIGRGGWYAVHLSWYDVRRRPGQVRARIRAVVGARSAHPVA
jgi:hypothetical protein